MNLIYFDYQGKLSPNEDHYLVEVSKKNADGVERNLIELRIAASSLLLNGLSEVHADVRINSPGPSEIEKTRFDGMTKEEVFRCTDGAIYRVIEKSPDRTTTS
jgi:hypothetical protein